MVERVARAIAQADEQNGGPPYEYRIGMGKHVREHLFDEARAALEAVRDHWKAEMRFESARADIDAALSR